MVSITQFLIIVPLYNIATISDGKLGYRIKENIISLLERD